MRKTALLFFIYLCVINILNSKEKSSLYQNKTNSNNNQLITTLKSIQTIEDSILIPEQLEEPIFSVERGYYYSPFILQIYSHVVGTHIRYTLDGSDPRFSNSTIIRSQPAEVTIDPDSTTLRGKTPGVVVRACLAKHGFIMSNVITHTFLFPEKVKEQTYPGYNWPQAPINEQLFDYEMDPDVVNDARYADLIDVTLVDLPIVSLVTDQNNLFQRDTGIYVNAYGDTRFWERQVSIEMFDKDGTSLFQIDGGLRIRGGYSRTPQNPKHAFRLFFRKEYGKAKLEFPLFGDEGATTFDNIDLRTSQNYSWSFNSAPDNTKNTMVREVFSRDLQREMGQPYTRSRYYHLYVNGVYWGLYQSQERPEASYAETYFGGNKSDYDVVKNEDGEINATDGTLEAYERLWQIASNGFENNENYFLAQGLNTDGKKNIEYEKLLDVDNVIDYMIITYFVGDFDSPISWFMGNTGVNNFYGIYNREEPDGFKFFRHDAEHSLFSLNEDRTGPFPAGNQFMTFNPQWLHQQLTQNEEYLIRFADRVNKHFSKRGILYPDNSTELIKQRIQAIDTAIIAESARWGDSKTHPPRTKDDHWQVQIDYILNEYLPQRPEIVLNQFKNKNWYPEISAPVFTMDEEEIIIDKIEPTLAIIINISNPNSNGNIYYTTNGTDPREIGGDVNENAILATGNVNVSISTKSNLKARIENNGKWSPIKELKILMQESYERLIISEIHYNPLEETETEGRYFEFIELKNNGAENINLSLCKFIDGISYTFTKEKFLLPDDYLILCSNADEFKNRYNFNAYDEYTGNLNNAGERILMVNPFGDTILSVRYNDKAPWPIAADGTGFSIVPKDEGNIPDYDDPFNWRASSAINGSPGILDPDSNILPVLINEILANSNYPNVDFIELYNPNDVPVKIDNWLLTDNFNNPPKWKIPAGTTIESNGFLVFFEGHYTDTVMNYDTNEFGSKFSLSSLGEEVYIFSANDQENLTGYTHGFSFDLSDEDISLGRFVTSEDEEHFVRLDSVSLNDTNYNPKVGPLVINKIMYNPNGGFEFIELINITDSEVPLSFNNIGWKIRGIEFDFEPGNTIAAGDTIYLVNKKTNIDEFKFTYNLNDSIGIYYYNGKLNNDGEELTILKPWEEDTNDTIDYYLALEKIEYNDNLPWPDADGNGYYLERINCNEYGNDPINWDTTKNNPVIIADMPKGVKNVFYYSKALPLGIEGPFIWQINNNDLPDGIIFNITNGEFTGIPTEQGVFEFDLSITNNNDKTISRSLKLEIIPNSSPITFDDLDSLTMNTTQIIDILSNDEDKGDKYSWKIKIVTPPQHGTIEINEYNFLIAYTPDLNYEGTDEFYYEASNTEGKDTAKVKLEIISFNEQDYNSLITLFNSTGGENWTDNTGWNSGINNLSNEWYGVDVRNGRVVGLYLQGNNLRGTLPPEIGNLTGLEVFFAFENNISGPIPKEIGNLTNLFDFEIYFNNLSGEIPTEIGNCTNLVAIILAWNKLEGEIPKEIGNLSQLVYLYLFDNNLEGEVPVEITQLSNLRTLWINGNDFTELPDLSDMQFETPVQDNYAGLNVSLNRFSFEDLAPSIDVLTENWMFSPQQQLEVDTTRIELRPGEELRLSIDEVEGTNNQYQWFKNNSPVSDKKVISEFIIQSVETDDIGRYQCKVTNSILPELTLTSKIIRLDVNTSINNHNNKEFINIYSFRNNIYINLNSSIDQYCNVTIYNIYGQKIINKKFNEKSIKLNIDQPFGYYIVEVKTGETIVTEKLFISR